MRNLDFISWQGPVHTADLVISLRDFIRGVLDRDPVPPGLAIPRQGPAARPSAAPGGKGEGADSRGGKAGASKGAGGDAMAGGASLEQTELHEGADTHS